MRTATVDRTTGETKISLYLNLDGSGRYDIQTGVGFFDHMLELLTRHARFDITLRCEGDTQVDYHHTVEDTGLVLGRAIDQALGGREGITRYGNAILPMDEALSLTALDISGRPFLVWDVEIPAQKVGDFDTELVREFFEAVCREARLTLNIRMLSGANSHHIIESVFKGFARAMRQAAAIDPSLKGEVPSTKGSLREGERA